MLQVSIYWDGGIKSKQQWVQSQWERNIAVNRAPMPRFIFDWSVKTFSVFV